MRKTKAIGTNDPVRYKEIILGLLSIGRTANEIGRAIGISGRTVEVYIAKLKKQLQVNNITHLVSTALRNKIIK